MTDTEKPRDRPLGVAAGSLVVVVGAALPWGRSGSRDRSSFEIVQVADRNEFLSPVVAEVARLWLAVPLALALVVVAVAASRHRTATAVGTVLAAAGVGLAAAVAASPLVPRYGIHVTVVGAAVVLADAARLHLLGTREPRSANR